MSVQDVVDGFLAAYGVPGWPVRTPNGKAVGEQDRVELGYAAAQADLGWRPVWGLASAVTASAAWYRAAPAGPAALAATMDNQIAAYAAEASQAWAAAAAA
jgi:nucleoside-diphosphate-sugar epimerase